jgi:isoquinoline 1-oxidoreductase alpha subunit
MVSFTVNAQAVQVDAEPDTPLLWVLRDYLNLTGTKFGCGVAACGACTVHLDGQPSRSCVVPVSACEGKEVTTIEGLAHEGGLHPVQQAWIDHQVPQCGYCQSGMIMRMVACSPPRPTQ